MGQARGGDLNAKYDYDLASGHKFLPEITSPSIGEAEYQESIAAFRFSSRKLEYVDNLAFSTILPTFYRNCEEW